MITLEDDDVLCDRSGWMDIEENGVVEQHDEPKMENSGPLLSGDGVVVVVAFKEIAKKHVQMSWRKVKIALEKHGLTCELDLVQRNMLFHRGAELIRSLIPPSISSICSQLKRHVKKACRKAKLDLKDYGLYGELDRVEDAMLISLTQTPRVAIVLAKARDIGCLLAKQFPVNQAIRILDGNVLYDNILIRPVRVLSLSKYGQQGLQEEYRKRRARLIGPKKATLNALCKRTNCYGIIYGYFFPVVGPYKGLKAVRRIVEDCFINGGHPAFQIRKLNKAYEVGNIKVLKKGVNIIRMKSDLEEHMKTQFLCYEDTYTMVMEAMDQGKYESVLEMIQCTDVLEKYADKFSTSNSMEVHANIAQTLCALIRFAPPVIYTKICSTSFIGRLFQHALEDSRPKRVLVNVLSVCISLLEPRRPTLTRSEQTSGLDKTHRSIDIANPDTVVGMLDILGDLLKLLDVSSMENLVLTTYGKLQPPLGEYRLKIVEFISLLLKVGGEAVEKELIRLEAVQRILDLFFKYPYNNFLHHHVENIIVACLESKNATLLQHVFCECDLVGKILQAENKFKLVADPNNPTVPNEGRPPPRIGNIGHLTRISNKIIQLGNSDSEIQAYLQDNKEWTDRHTNVISKRNEVEDAYRWACGHPTSSDDSSGDLDEYRKEFFRMYPTLKKAAAAFYS